MRVYFPKFEDIEHKGGEYKSDYSIDWERGQQKYKQPRYTSPWRVYENGSVRFMSDGSGKPEKREEFENGTQGTGQIVLAKEAPVLYCGERKVIKKHTFPQYAYRPYYAKYAGIDVSWWASADTILIDHQYGVAQALTGHGIFLPYNGAQVIVAHPARFKVYWVDRALIKLHNERAGHIKGIADTVTALADNNHALFQQWRNEITPEIFKQMRKDFVNGEFGHWTSAMFYHAHSKFNDNDTVFLYSMAPRTVTSRLYTQPMRLSSPPRALRWRTR